MNPFSIKDMLITHYGADVANITIIQVKTTIWMASNRNPN